MCYLRALIIFSLFWSAFAQAQVSPLVSLNPDIKYNACYNAEEAQLLPAKAGRLDNACKAD